MHDITARIAVFTPTQAELAGPLRSLEVARQVRDGILVMAIGNLHGVETVLVRTGIGPQNAAAAAERIFDSFSPSEVLIIGFGGATTLDVGAGDLVGCSEIVDLTGESGSTRIACSSFLLERALQTGLLSTVAAAATVPRVVSSAQEKQAIGREFGTAVVEMEGFPILKMSEDRQVPALMIRAVLDTAEENLPETTHLVTEAGKPRPGKVLAYLARRPKDAAFFSSLRKRVKVCRRVMNEFLERYLRLR